MDISKTIAPKTDQLNGDDLIAGPRTITITRVTEGASSEQPVNVYFQGDDGKPWRPCKTMRRLLVLVWGKDAKEYTGRSLTLYRDAKVRFGSDAVGGVRVSHMTHIDETRSLALTASKGKKATVTVHPLQQQQQTAKQQQAQPATPALPPAEAFAYEYDQCDSQAVFDALEATRAANWKRWNADDQRAIRAAVDAAKTRLAEQKLPAELFGGDTRLPD